MENKITIVTEPEKLQRSPEMIFSTLQCEIDFEFFQKLQPDDELIEKKHFQKLQPDELIEKKHFQKLQPDELIEKKHFQKLQPDDELIEKKQFLMQDFKERNSPRSKTDFTSVRQAHNTLLIKHDLENLIKKKDPKMNSINDKIWFGPTKKDFVPKTIDQIKKLFVEDLKKKMAVYYRWETKTNLADITFSSFIIKGILYFPKQEIFYKLNFECHYDKRTYMNDDDKNPNLNPYCIANWERVFPKDFLYSFENPFSYMQSEKNFY